MKLHILILAAAVLVLPCCTTTTSTAPDGTVTVTKRLDSEAIKASGTVARTVIPVFYTPNPATGGKTPVVVEPQPTEPGWLGWGLNLLGL